MDQSLVALVSRFQPLRKNGNECIGPCCFCGSAAEDSLKVGEATWRTTCCCAQEENGSDSIGWLMSWSGCTREEAAAKLGNGGVDSLPVLPVQVSPLKRTPFWGLKALVDNPKWKVWIHERAEAVEAGRKLFPDRVHLGLRYRATFDDLSILSGRFCVLLPMNRLSSLEKMRGLAARLLAEGHKEVRIIDLSKS